MARRFVASTGFSILGFGTPSRNSRAAAVNAPPVTKDHPLGLLGCDALHGMIEVHARHLGHHHVRQDHIEALPLGDQGQRFFRAGQGDDIEVVAKRPLQRATHRRFVVDYQHSGQLARRRPHRLCLHVLAVTGRQQDDAKESALADFAFDFDSPTELQDDSMGDG